MNAKAGTEFFSKEASARAAEAVRKAPKVGVTPGTLAPRAPGKPRPKHRDPTRPIGYYHADTMCYRDDPESRAKAEAWSMAIVTCPFCGGDPSPVECSSDAQSPSPVGCSNDARSPSPVDCSNDAAIALALSTRWA